MIYPIQALRCAGTGEIGLTHREEVRPEPADQCLNHDLETGSEEVGVENAEEGVVEDPERRDDELGEEEDEDGDAD